VALLCLLLPTSKASAERSLSTDSVGAAPVEASVGAAAPRFYLPSLGGGDFFLSKWCGERRGRSIRRRPPHTVVLSFFATWCVPCRAELPLLQELSQSYEDQPVAWRLVNLGDTPDSARAFLDRLSVDTPVLMDRYRQTSKRYCGDRVPTIAVIDREGIVRYLHHGFDAEHPRAEMRRVAEAVSATLDIPVPDIWRCAPTE
jgi:thiol-disulfide isomerase/thioredoxin